MCNFHFAHTEIETQWDLGTDPKSYSKQMAQPGFKLTYDSKVLPKSPDIKMDNDVRRQGGLEGPPETRFSL